VLKRVHQTAGHFYFYARTKMKWFKHISTAMDDLFVKDLERKFSHAGYAFWFKTLELIAAHGEDGTLEISWSNYLDKLHMRRPLVEQLLDFCHTQVKLLSDSRPDSLKISCPKFLEYADNYTKYRKDQEDRQSNFVESTKQEEEGEKKKKEKKNIAIPPQLLLVSGFELLWKEWLDYRQERRLTCSPRCLEKQLLFLSTQPKPINIINQSIQQGWQGLFEEKSNGTQSGNNKNDGRSDQTKRATFEHKPEDVERFRTLQATLRADSERRSKRSGLDSESDGK
jgi:hypothetical protein